MESDYDAIIIKKQLPGLSMMRQAEADAKTLLAIDPTEQDANVALGMSNYVIGSLPSYKRAFLWFGGLHGDRSARHGTDGIRRRARPLLTALCESNAGSGLRTRT